MKHSNELYSYFPLDGRKMQNKNKNDKSEKSIESFILVTRERVWQWVNGHLLVAEAEET